jgi:hypothetical protein
MDAVRDPSHVDALRAAGASGAALEALLAYTVNPFDGGRLAAAQLPLADEPHLEAWADYLRDAAGDGVLPALARRLVQLRFPVAEGISQSEDYRAATRRGLAPPSGAAGVAVEDPAGIGLVLHRTLAGRIPLVTCRSRSDFVTLVRALSCRNEPEHVPGAMGACIVSGLNNWDRVARARRRLEEERGAPFDETGWTAAFRTIAADKSRYQDRLILLSREPYSGVPASAIGMPDDEWRAHSVVIRGEHECTHYFTLRVFGVMRNNLLDEIIADFAGLARAFGRYEARLELRCLGLESFPDYRAGGRFENYLKTPPVPPDAVATLQGLVVRAVHAIEAASRGADLSLPSERARFVVALAGATLVELARSDGAARLAERALAVPPIAAPASHSLDAPAPFG